MKNQTVLLSDVEIEMVSGGSGICYPGGRGNFDAIGAGIGGWIGSQTPTAGAKAVGAEVGAAIGEIVDPAGGALWGAAIGAGAAAASGAVSLTGVGAGSYLGNYIADEIYSQFCGPQATSFDGSGLDGSGWDSGSWAGNDGSSSVGGGGLPDRPDVQLC